MSWTKIAPSWSTWRLPPTWPHAWPPSYENRGRDRGYDEFLVPMRANTLLLEERSSPRVGDCVGWVRGVCCPPGDLTLAGRRVPCRQSRPTTPSLAWRGCFPTGRWLRRPVSSRPE